MTTPLVTQSGTPVLTPQGNLQYIFGADEVKQQIVNALSTQFGSESLFEEYGFDAYSVYTNINSDKELMIKMAVLDALNPRLMPSINEIYRCDVTVTGTTAYVNLGIRTKDSENLNVLYNVEV